MSEINENVVLSGLGLDVKVDSKKIIHSFYGYGKAKLIAVNPTVELLAEHGIEVDEVVYLETTQPKGKNVILNMDGSYTFRPRLEPQEDGYEDTTLVTISLLVELSDKDKSKKLINFKFYRGLYSGFITKKKEAMLKFITDGGAIMNEKVSQLSDETSFDFDIENNNLYVKDKTYPLPLEYNGYVLDFLSFMNFIKVLLRVDNKQPAILPISLLLKAIDKGEAAFNKTIKALFNEYKKLTSEMVEPFTFNVCYAATQNGEYVNSKPILFGVSYEEGQEKSMMLQVVGFYNKEMKEYDGLIPTHSSKGWWFDIDDFKKNEGFREIPTLKAIEAFNSVSAPKKANNNTGNPSKGKIDFTIPEDEDSL